jgi:hypothetical protein
MQYTRINSLHLHCNITVKKCSKNNSFDCRTPFEFVFLIKENVDVSIYEIKIIYTGGGALEFLSDAEHA